MNLVLAASDKTHSQPYSAGGHLTHFTGFTLFAGFTLYTLCTLYANNVTDWKIKYFLKSCKVIKRYY